MYKSTKKRKRWRQERQRLGSRCQIWRFERQN